MKDKTNVRNMLRLTTIKRWQIVEMLKEQSVAEHVYRVFILVRDLLDDLEDIPHNSFEHQAAQLWAIVHDMEEVFTGDMPATVKQVLEKLSPGIGKKLKEEILTVHFPTLLTQTRGLDNTVTAIYVKVAEIVEQILYVNEYAVNPTRAIEVRMSLFTQLADVLTKAKDKYRSIPWKRVEDWVSSLLASGGHTIAPTEQSVDD